MAQARIDRGQGVTGAERYLVKLAEKSFLRLWSYPNIFRDQGGKVGNNEGKEICDLLVVCDPHIILFSDKDCAFPDTGNIEKDWARWFRRAVWKSAKQLWGAARWIGGYPDRLFLDGACTRSFPIPLPSPEKAKIHLIVVAHGSGERCKRELGGSGSLMILPSRIGLEAHTDPAKGGTPFAVGWLDEMQPYVHVLDDFSLEVLMRTLDTITDFASYLDRKQAFIESLKLGAVPGEEELLALYLQQTDGEKEHCFPMDHDVNRNFFAEGGWEEFVQGPRYRSWREANQISYAWDQLIEHFSRYILDGTIIAPFNPQTAELEELMRHMAKVPRLVRRELARSLLEIVLPESDGKRHTRIVPPIWKGLPYFLFLVLPYDSKRPYDQYRKGRVNLLSALCAVLKLRFPEAVEVVGLAFEPGEQAGTSQDAIYRDFSEWSPKHDDEARKLAEEYGLLDDLSMSRRAIMEYPSEAPSEPKAQFGNRDRT